MIQPEDEAAIRQLGAAWDEAWNRHNMNALANLVTPNVDFIHVGGGPEELEQALSPFTPFRGLAAYYLAVHPRHRDNPGGKSPVNPSSDRGHALAR